MTEKIIKIIEKEEFITDLNSSYINLQHDMLNDKAYLTIKSKKDEVSVEVVPNFILELSLLIKSQNYFLVMSDSDIVNFKNNLITLINNYFE
ncbi:MAG TPA: hypothetical protein PLH46_06740 [Caldisericia bacterium]|nr:hypothetical protein [Caldisericia bacterium]